MLVVTITAAMLLVWLLPINVCHATNVWDEAGLLGNSSSVSIQIVNGHIANPCQWRWQVSFQGSCGGTLIAPSWIISAAHCAGLRTVTVGDFNIKSDRDNPGKVKTFNVKQWIKHPKYKDPRGNSHDFALVEIEGIVETNECVGFAKLPSSRLAPGKKCYITGWGTLSQDGRQPAKLQQAVVTTMSNAECKQNYGNSISADMLCAQGKTDNGKIIDACQGDSGGPLVCEEDGKYIIHGATSWGRGCAKKNFPGIWARVFEVMDFIDEHLRGGGSGCEDTDNGKKDKDGDGCSWYTEFDPTRRRCGRHDDSDFEANKMCCHCGGGTGEQPTPAPMPDPNACKDTDGNAKDSDGDDCAWYTEHDEHGEHCGHHDDDDFNANRMCCRCGGGSTGSGFSRLFEYAGSPKPVTKKQILSGQQTLGMAVGATMAGIAALVVATRRVPRCDDPGILAAGSDAELEA